MDRIPSVSLIAPEDISQRILDVVDQYRGLAKLARFLNLLEMMQQCSNLHLPQVQDFILNEILESIQNEPLACTAQIVLKIKPFISSLKYEQNLKLLEQSEKYRNNQIQLAKFEQYLLDDLKICEEHQIRESIRVPILQLNFCI